jgi:hypothetical protein
VVRLGHVTCIERERIVLEHGEIPTTPGSLHVHCAAIGLNFGAPVPVFGSDRISVQMTRFGFAPFSAALIGFVEASVDDEAQKNRLCPALGHPNTPSDFLRILAASMVGDFMRSQHPVMASWLGTSRLNAMSGLAAHADAPEVREARARLKTHGPKAASNLAKLASLPEPAP